MVTAIWIRKRNKSAPSEDQPAGTRNVGQRAEARAEQHLHASGLQTVAKNYRTVFGEVDLIMRDADTLVFVEVRYRKTARFVSPGETVDTAKQRRLCRTAEHFLQHHARYAEMLCRFDVVSIVGSAKSQKLEWITDAFSPQ